MRSLRNQKRWWRAYLTVPALCLAVLAAASVSARGSSAAAMAAAQNSPPEVIPNDPEWFDPSNPEDPSTAGRMIHLPEAWAVTLGDPRVIIAIVDTGVNPDPDLPNLIQGYNALDGGTDTTDHYGHGTAVAKVAGAAINNGIGGVGVCPHCSIMPLMGWDGSGISSSAAAEEIRYAVDHGASVINLSFAPPTGQSTPSYLNDAIGYACSHEVLVTIAAGNYGSDDPNSDSLASSNPCAIRVAATGLGGLENYSNYGAWTDIAAPDFLGAIPGTSAAAPVVAGEAGLLDSYALQHGQKLGLDQLRHDIIACGTPSNLPVASGNLVDVYHALECAGYTPPPPPVKYCLTVQVIGRGAVSRQPAGQCFTATNPPAHVRLTAKPKARFWRWQGACSGRKPACMVTMNGKKMVRAVFRRR